MSTENIHYRQAARDAKARWWHRINVSDLIITIVLLVVFGGAFLMALGYKELAGYFPLGVSALGIVGALTFLVRVLFFPRKPEAPKGALPEESQSFSDAEYEFFRSLTARDWLQSSAWLAGFYVLLGVAGIYVATAVFTIAYLKFDVKKSWLFSAIYAVVLTGLVWVLFTMVLVLPLPGGLLELA